MACEREVKRLDGQLMRRRPRGIESNDCKGSGMKKGAYESGQKARNEPALELETESYHGLSKK